MKHLIIMMLIVLFAVPCYSLELVRQKNVATVIFFPLKDTDGNNETGEAASGDTEIDQWNDGADPDGWADLTGDEIAESGTSGWYYVTLAQADMNFDYIAIQVKSTGALTQNILIRTIVGDPLNLATSDDGGSINVTGGAVDTVTTTTTATNLTTNNDKTGYALSAAGNTAVTDDWQTQAAADPTTMQVNVMEVNGTAQTANDNGADINAILVDTDTTIPGLISTRYGRFAGVTLLSICGFIVLRKRRLRNELL